MYGGARKTFSVKKAIQRMHRVSGVHVNGGLDLAGLKGCVRGVTGAVPGQRDEMF